MTIFTGGGNFQPTDYTGIVQSGSDSTHIILDTVAGLNVGDLIMAPAAGRSVYCTSSAKGCWAGGTRTGKVTAINSLTATVIPWGPGGIDVAPTTGGTSRWNGNQLEHIQLRHNSIVRHYSLPFSGKGYIELKNCTFCLIDGNTMTDAPIGNWFLTVRNQAGNDPWNRGQQLRFSSNLVGGANGSPSRMALQGEDDEETSTLSSQVYFINNLLPDVFYDNPATASPHAALGELDHGGGFLNAGWLHNTALAKVGSSGHKSFDQGGCLTSPSNYIFSTGTAVKDNILSYGNGFDVTSCLTDQAALMKNNLFHADGTVNASTIKSTWSGNNAEDVLANLGLVGACTFTAIDNCALAPGSTYKATASDGGDPGADIPQVKDRIKGWSEQAGLVAPDTNLAAMRADPKAFGVGSTRAVIRFWLRDSAVANCTLKLYTNRARVTLHGDTDTGGEQACNRSGNLLNGNLVTFVLGTNTALTASTTYFYQITDGTRVMVGSFTTAASGSGLNSLVQVSDSAANNLVVEYATASDFSGSTTTSAVLFASQRAGVTFPISANTVVYYRWKKRDNGNTVLATGETRVRVAP